MDQGEEIEALTAGLHAWDVRFLGPTPLQALPERPDPELLITALARSRHPRLRSALIALFLRHPELAGPVPRLAASLEEPAGKELRFHYQAAVYLQRLWRTRLELYLGPVRPLPDHLSGELGLPPPERRHGKLGLQALARLHGEHSSTGGNFLARYQRILELLIGQLRLELEPAELPA